VTAGYANQSHRSRTAVVAASASATASAQPTCRDGIAANWLARPSLPATGPYTDCPKRTPVSTKPCCGSIRGGASG
jgi:hypothetical protein